jgi:hypothetical protein
LSGQRETLVSAARSLASSLTDLVRAARAAAPVRPENRTLRYPFARFVI